jgi:hypothetical protein
MAYKVENAARSTKVTKTNAVVRSMCRRSALGDAAAAETVSTSSNLELTRRALNATTMRSRTATSHNNCTGAKEPASIFAAVLGLVL